MESQIEKLMANFVQARGHVEETYLWLAGGVRKRTWQLLSLFVLLKNLGFREWKRKWKLLETLNPKRYCSFGDCIGTGPNRGYYPQ